MYTYPFQQRPQSLAAESSRHMSRFGLRPPSMIPRSLFPWLYPRLSDDHAGVKVFIDLLFIIVFIIIAGLLMYFAPQIFNSAKRLVGWANNHLQILFCGRRSRARLGSPVRQTTELHHETSAWDSDASNLDLAEIGTSIDPSKLRMSSGTDRTESSGPSTTNELPRMSITSAYSPNNNNTQS
ncbi:hypothetical protein L228DRAFT_76886 [Xylona heveae TC161]|uniref:Uncharacterized protein n=1 Tax=Xylona heveae (strain CBS 132557 / TC161) TaxID=1328760 RepID=A0A165IVY1_XYLHT|nr:hypothetical protein L228DRAFT_76886 [Xylona heveae TC161]KZF25456.1 hypothetical protein L228DRAFT_76886 [Xylona heveae TC161]